MIERNTEGVDKVLLPLGKGKGKAIPLQALTGI
jgi:hypothetical protein